MMLLAFLFIQEEDGVYSCICTEGFTGEKCSTPAPSNSGPSPRPQNREGPGGMSTAAIAGTVAGIVLAVLICCVVLAVVVVCVRLRRRRRTQSKYNLHVYTLDLIKVHGCI